MFPEKIGKYDIIRELGRGGMGTVYEGFDPRVHRRVAIKVLHEDYKSIPEIVDRFLNEARAANRIGHPGVVQVSECDTLADGTAFMVMEYLDGHTLTVRLAEHAGQLPLWMALNIASQVAETVHCGHENGIIHRDLKPDNIMIIVDSIAPGGERCKIFDFGIAKNTLSKSKQETGTHAKVILGTRGYMPPEQLRGAGYVTAQSDVYSLGVILYQMIAGQRPFVADNDADLDAMVLRDEAPAITQFAKDVPDALVQLLQRMLTKQAKDRPLMLAVLETLSEISQGVPVPVSGRLLGRRPSGADIKEAKEATLVASAGDKAQDNHKAKAHSDPVPETFVPVKRPKKIDEPALTNERVNKNLSELRSVNSNNSLVNGQRKPRFAAFEKFQDKRVAVIAGILITVFAGVVVYWQISRNPVVGPVVAVDMYDGKDEAESPVPDLIGPQDLSLPPDLRSPVTSPDMREHGGGGPPHPQCPPVFTAACVRGKNVTRAQKLLFAERLNSLKPRPCLKMPLILIRQDSWFRPEIPLPAGISEVLISSLLDDAYSYWRAKKLSLVELPEKVEITCPRN